MINFFKGKKFDFYLAVFLLVLSLATAFAGATSYFIPDGRKTTSTDYIVPTQDSPGLGFLSPATPTVSVTSAAVTSVGTMPAGTKKLKVWVLDGIAYYGGANMTVGSAAEFPEIASGGYSEEISIGTTTPVWNWVAKTGTIRLRPMPR